MSLNDKLLKAAATSGITPSEHFGVMLYEGDGSSSHSINGGKFGAGAYFNGSNSRIDITRPFPNQQAYSVSFWFFAENNPASSMRVFDSSENDWSGMFQFIHASDGKGYYYVGNGSSSESGQITTASITDGTWKHIVCVYDPDGGSTSGKTYINGSLDSSFNAAAASPNDGNTSMTIGCMNRTSGTKDKFFEGKLDQVRFFTKSLSSSEVSTLYAETDVESLDPLSEDTTDTLQVLGDSSCVATYRFENNEDDLSGNYDGTGTEIQYAAGRYGQAASFNGSTSNVDIGSFGSVFQQDFSVSLWFNLDSLSAFNNLFSAQDDYYVYIMARNDISKVRTSIEVAPSTAYIIDSGTISTDRWYHAVITVSSTDGFKFYMDNELQGTQSGATGNLRTMSGKSFLGAYQASSTFQYPTDGRIDQVRIFNKALSASEVTTLYEENSLVASYRFEGNSNDDRRTFDGTDSNVTYEFGVNFTPDLVWLKNRSTARSHLLVDSSRGRAKNIYPDSANAETTSNAGNDFVSFDTGGFTVGSTQQAYANDSGDEYVAWCWKAGGGTTSSNSDGEITVNIQANQDAGFSIITFYGITDPGDDRSFGHGLSKEPEFIWMKRRGSAQHNAVFAKINGGWEYFDVTSSTDGGGDYDSYIATTSTVIDIHDAAEWFADASSEYVYWCWHSVDNYSKIGTYTGTASDLNIDCGFSAGARLVLIKRTDSTGDWYLWDSVRGIVAGNDYYILLNTTDAQNSSYDYIDPLSSGFTVTSSANADLNASGGSYLFLAIA